MISAEMQLLLCSSVQSYMHGHTYTTRTVRPGIYAMGPVRGVRHGSLKITKIHNINTVSATN